MRRQKNNTFQRLVYLLKSLIQALLAYLIIQFVIIAIVKSKQMLKTRILSLALIGALIACSTSDVVSPLVAAVSSGSCSVTFKSTSYSLPIVSCFSSGTSEGASGTNANSQSVTLSRDTSDPTQKSIIFIPTAGGGSYVSTPTPTISVSGKVWTFSGAMMNGSGDTGNISGTCTCN